MKKRWKLFIFLNSDYPWTAKPGALTIHGDRNSYHESVGMFFDKARKGRAEFLLRFGIPRDTVLIDRWFDRDFDPTVVEVVLEHSSFPEITLSKECSDYISKIDKERENRK